VTIELVIRRVLAGKKAQFGPVEGGVQELVDCLLQILCVANTPTTSQSLSGFSVMASAFSCDDGVCATSSPFHLAIEQTNGYN
jgi:hypothetical protein